MAVERFTLQLHDKNDADIVEYLNRQSNKNGAIKMALREQIGQEAYLKPGRINKAMTTNENH